METTPLEALIVGPDEVLILRLPAVSPDMELDMANEAHEWARRAGLGLRVLTVTHDVELAKVQADGM